MDHLAAGLACRPAVQPLRPPVPELDAVPGITHDHGIVRQFNQLHHPLVGRAQRSFVGKYLPREVVHGLVNEHLSGKRDHQRRLYALLNLELWARHFILKQSIS